MTNSRPSILTSTVPDGLPTSLTSRYPFTRRRDANSPIVRDRGGPWGITALVVLCVALLVACAPVSSAPTPVASSTPQLSLGTSTSIAPTSNRLSTAQPTATPQ